MTEGSLPVIELHPSPATPDQPRLRVGVLAEAVVKVAPAPDGGWWVSTARGDVHVDRPVVLHQVPHACVFPVDGLLRAWPHLLAFAVIGETLVPVMAVTSVVHVHIATPTPTATPKPKARATP